MRRDSPPDPARAWPGATASTSVTSQPVIAQRRASAAPKTPAPTTMTDRLTAPDASRPRGPASRPGVRGVDRARTAAAPRAGSVEACPTSPPCSTDGPRPGLPAAASSGATPPTGATSSRPSPWATTSTFVDACGRARAAQAAWAATPAPVRGRAVQQAGRLVEANAEALARTVTREVGKPLAEARAEVQEVVDTCDFFLGEGRRLYGQTVPSELPDKQLFTFRAPVGVAAIVTAGNFPVAVPSWYLVPALLCGNAVVWKPSEEAAACADALARLLLHAGLPEGVLQLVLADGAGTAAGLEAALAAGWSTRSASPARRRSGAGSASSAAATCSRPAWSSGGRTRSSSARTRTSTWPWRARSSAASARPASAAPRSASPSCTRTSTTSSWPSSPRGWRTRRSATRRRTCSTGR